MFKIQILLCLTFAALIVNSRRLGAPKELTGDELKEAEQTLEASLSKLASGEGPSYKIGKINKATRQLVSGVIYKYEVELIDDKKAVKKCNVKIWSQAWLKVAVQVTFECEGEESVTAKLDKIN